MPSQKPIELLTADCAPIAPGFVESVGPFWARSA
jgi:hypothetical protein